MAPSGWLTDLDRVDLAVYAAVARTPTPTLDAVLSRVSRAANYSQLSMGIAALLALLGGSRGRRAAASGLACVGLTSLTVNLVCKPLGRRTRPDRVAGSVPIARYVRMPVSRSFPSGHAASAFAFATGVGHVLPTVAGPLRGLATVVAYSRVHTGVHYPGDVIFGGLLGTVIGELGMYAVDRGHRRGHRHSSHRRS